MDTVRLTELFNIESYRLLCLSYSVIVHNLSVLRSAYLILRVANMRDILHDVGLNVMCATISSF